MNQSRIQHNKHALSDSGLYQINFENNLNPAIHAILQLYGLATGTLDFDKHMQSHVRSELVSQKQEE